MKQILSSCKVSFESASQQIFLILKPLSPREQVFLSHEPSLFQVVGCVVSPLDIPNVETVDLPDSFNYVEFVQINSRSEETESPIDVNPALTSLIHVSKVPDMITEMSATITEMIIPNDSCNEPGDCLFNLSPFKQLQRLEIGNDCFEKVYRFVIDGLPFLQSVKIGKNSFTREKNNHQDNPHRLFQLVNCPQLQSLDIGRYSFSDYGGALTIRNCNLLKTMKIGEVGYESCNFYDAPFKLDGCDVHHV